jgi:hypothetical protein
LGKTKFIQEKGLVGIREGGRGPPHRGSFPGGEGRGEKRGLRDVKNGGKKTRKRGKMDKV